jgi:PAS domain-containing protein
MDYKFLSELKDGYLHIRVEGDYATDTMRRWVAEGLEACRRHGCSKVLVEERLAGDSLGLGDIFWIVTEWSQAAQLSVTHMAYVDIDPGHRNDLCGFAETVARNRGLNLRAFGSIEEAERWLVGETHLAPAARASEDRLRGDVDYVVRHPVVTMLMNASSGLLAVLNEQRQILALNEAFLRTLGIADAGEVLGFRPGEAIRCVRSGDAPGGCGTGRYCPTCGAAVAILASLDQDRPEERKCVMTVPRDGVPRERCFLVRSSPLRLGERRCLLLFMQDITVSERRSESERVFFHDLANLITALGGWVEQLDPASSPEVAERLRKLALRLGREVRFQRVLLDDEAGELQCHPQPVAVEDVLEELRAFLAAHPAAQGKRLNVGPSARATIHVDPILLSRVLVNMAVNALEATPPGGEVKVWVQEEGGSLLFQVWNRAPIPPDVALRVFQRHFSTRDGPGRGLGTCAMKRIGEGPLRGQVDFVSSPLKGTVFRLRLPLPGAPQA